jgi:hypothetical protein
MTTNQGLAEQIEQLVRDHFAANRAAVAAAVERAFAGVNAVAGSDARPSRATGGDARPKARARTRAKPAPRRAVEEVVALGERFYAALCRSPGEMMKPSKEESAATAGGTGAGLVFGLRRASCPCNLGAKNAT